MKHDYMSLMAVSSLMIFLSGCENPTVLESGKTESKAAPVPATTVTTPVDGMAMEAVAERMRQTSMDMQADIRQARTHREMLETQHEAERKNEAERVRQQAVRDAAQLAALKSSKERQALEAAQAHARQEVAERAAKAERERQAALEAQRALERNSAKAQATKAQATKAPAAKEPAAKAVNGGRQLGGEVNFGADI